MQTWSRPGAERWIVGLTLACAGAAPLRAQGAGAGGADPETEKLRAEMRALERRLAEVEGRSAKPAEAVAVKAATPAQGEPAKPAAPDEPWWKTLISEGTRFKLYGFLRLDLQADDSRPNNTQTIGWILSEDPTAPNFPGGKNREDLTIHPRLTRLGLDFDGGVVNSLDDAKLTGKVEVDFFNNGLAGQSESREALRMRHAWLKLAWTEFSLLAGQTSDVISPLFPIVNADLSMWGAGNLGDRRPQLRGEYVKASGDSKWIFQGEVGLTAADDNQDLDANGFRDGEASGKPTLQARAAYRFPLVGQQAEVGVWGHRAWEQADKAVAPPSTITNGQDFDSDVFGVDVSMPLGTDKLNLKAEAWSGKNLDDVRGGIFQGVNAITGEEIHSEGGFVELGYKTTEHITLYAGVSRDDPDDDDVGTATNANNGRAKNSIWYLASRWSYKPVSFGLEYLNWTTDYVGFDEGTDNRIVGFIQYSF
jgi:hypothetical protein